MLITLTGLSAQAPVAETKPEVVPPASPPIEIVLHRRQATQLLLLALAIMLLTSATSYLVGKNAAETAQPAERGQPAIKPAPVPAAPPPAPAPPEPPATLVQGATYLQVAAVDPGIGEVFVEFLKRKYFSALIVPGPDPSTVRVLVGPVRDDDAYRIIRQDLLRAGFLSFPKKYTASAAGPPPTGWSAGQ